MRRRLALVSTAVTVLVVVAFLVPVALLIRSSAADRALSLAERDAQAIAAALAVVPATGAAEITPDLAATVLDAFGEQDTFSIIFTTGVGVGAPFEESPSIGQARGGAAFTAEIEDGAEVLVPVLVADTPDVSATVVVRTVVPEVELRRGVLVAWLMLGALGLFLVVVATLAADRMGRSIVRPVDELSAAARALGDGDLATRVEPAGPPEVAAVGEAFNFLARRLGALLSAERESVADLSHRLRTPLTALRLQAETLQNKQDSANLIADIERLERAISTMIEEARRPSAATGERDEISDLASVVRHRDTFWRVLADEQGRPVDIVTTGGTLPVALSAEELGALVDTLIENVFAYTPAGTAYSIVAEPGDAETVVLVVEDAGAGFSEEGAVERGSSGGGSTGLGLDIVRRSAQRTGGSLQIRTAIGGGARVEVTFRRARVAAGQAVSELEPVAGNPATQ